MTLSFIVALGISQATAVGVQAGVISPCAFDCIIQAATADNCPVQPLTWSCVCSNRNRTLVDAVNCISRSCPQLDLENAMSTVAQTCSPHLIPSPSTSSNPSTTTTNSTPKLPSSTQSPTLRTSSSHATVPSTPGLPSSDIPSSAPSHPPSFTSPPSEISQQLTTKESTATDRSTTTFNSSVVPSSTASSDPTLRGATTTAGPVSVLLMPTSPLGPPVARQARFGTHTRIGVAVGIGIVAICAVALWWCIKRRRGAPTTSLPSTRVHLLIDRFGLRNSHSHHRGRVPSDADHGERSNQSAGEEGRPQVDNATATGAPLLPESMVEPLKYRPHETDGGVVVAGGTAQSEVDALAVHRYSTSTGSTLPPPYSSVFGEA